jgi:DNA-binding response OmpR family regulator
MTAGKVLIVDDTAENLRLLGDMLEEAGYDLRVATTGEQAVEMARQEPPDIILLDVLMPGWGGHEVCRRLKADPRTAEIPIVFMTAYNDEADEAAGLELGAVDFVMKPFRPPVVLRRIANHLAYRRMQTQLREQAAGLEDLVARRTEELKRANERLTRLDASKTQYLRLLAHEVRAPAEGLVGVGELALQGIQDEAKRERLHVLFHTQKDRMEFLFDQYERLIDWQQIDLPARRLLPPVRLDELLAAAWEAQIDALREAGLKPPAAPESPLFVQGEAQLLQPVLTAMARWLTAVSSSGTAIAAVYEDADPVIAAWTVPGNWAAFAETAFSSLAGNELSMPSNARAWLPLLDTTLDALAGTVTVASDGRGLRLVLRLPAYRAR